MSKTKFVGPVTLEAVVHLVSEEGHTAKVTVGLAPGIPVTADDLLGAINQAARAGEKHSMKPMAPSTFFNHVLVKETTGRVGNFATPASMEYELESGVIEYRDEPADDDDDFLDEDE
jgi:hypothetical protein